MKSVLVRAFGDEFGGQLVGVVNVAKPPGTYPIASRKLT